MVPQYTKQGIDNYIDYGVPTGGFLRSVLENNLSETVARADGFNCINLADIVGYLNSFAPMNCWGSPERVVEWLALHRNEPETAENAAVQDREGRKNFGG